MNIANPIHDVPVDVSHQLPPATDSALRHKLDNLKGALSAQVQAKTSRIQQSMHQKPMLWAGVAGGTGMVLGLIGRFMTWKSKRPVPDLVIIDASC